MRRAERIVLGMVSAVAWTGLVLQGCVSFPAMLGEGVAFSDAVIRFFSFFTVLTNSFIAIDGTICALSGESRWARSRVHASLETCLAVSIFFVALIYAAFLRNLRHLAGSEILADRLIHTVVPLLYLIYWGLFAARHKLRWIDACFWPVYPFLYFLYALVQGWRTGLYPYPFIDVGRIGYGRVLMNGACLLTLFLLDGCAFIGLGRRLHQSRKR